LAGVILVTIPLALSGKLRISKKALPLILGSGVSEVTGFTCFALGAGYSIAITSVVSSQFAPIAAILAFILFKERLGKEGNGRLGQEEGEVPRYIEEDR
jgi:drug/metabolite transporter (DMT)-like permease